jgi:hypothetical protein
MKAQTYTVKICNKDVTIKKIRSTAIKAYCTDCSAGQITEVKECPHDKCPLYPFRGFVKWENTKTMSDEQKKLAGERMKAFHRAKHEK